MAEIIKAIFPGDWSTLLPDLLIGVISAAVPLLIQYWITIKPLQKSNKELTLKLNNYSEKIIDEYIKILDDELEMLKNDLVRIEERLRFAYEELEPNTSHYNNEIFEASADLDKCLNRMKQIPIDKMKFINDSKID